MHGARRLTANGNCGILGKKKKETARMTADNHIHTRFSPDGNGDPEAFVLAAIARGMRHVVFTEHVDLHYCHPDFAPVDLPAYFACVRQLQAKYADKIYVGAGLEVGYTPQNKADNKALIARYRPDYVINSVHQVGASDCWFPQYFADKSAREAYALYLDAVRESLNAPYEYHAVGHIGYVCRNAPFDTFLHSDHAAQTDAILQEVVKRGKILEINTSCRKPWLGTLPERALVLRYAALGGRKLCFASDAHDPKDLCRNYAAAKRLAADAGVAEQTVIEHGREIRCPF